MKKMSSDRRVPWIIPLLWRMSIFGAECNLWILRVHLCQVFSEDELQFAHSIVYKSLYKGYIFFGRVWKILYRILNDVLRKRKFLFRWDYYGLLVLSLAFEIRAVSWFSFRVCRSNFSIFSCWESSCFCFFSSILSWTCNYCIFWSFTRSNKILFQSSMISVSFKKEEPKNMQFNVKNFFCNWKILEFPLPETTRKNTSAFIPGE